MIGRIPVSARALRRRRIDIDDSVKGDVAVFPFFDAAGEVSFCMVVPRRDSRLYFFAPHEARPRVPVWGAIRFEIPIVSWSDGDDGPALDGMWHYDPDWLLRDTRFADKEIIPALRGTNCCEKLPDDVKCLYYRRDLSRVQTVLRGSSDHPRFVTLTDVLPPAPPEALGTTTMSQRTDRAGTWRLDPVWMRVAR